MKRYLKIGITGAAILASGILCAFVLFKMRIIIELLKGITGILKPFLYGAVIAYLLAPLCNKIEEKLQEQDVDFQKIKIVYKPASYKTIASVIKEKTERH